MNDPNMDQLVEMIAARVRNQILSPGTHDATPARSDRPSHHTSCSSCQIPVESCVSCGFHPSNAPPQLPPVQIPDPKGMARFIDHTLLKPQTVRSEIETLCKDARKHNFFSVCVNSSNVRLAANLLSGTNTKVCAVVGFPLGASTPGAKAFEAREAVRCGADEIDMVLNIGALRSRDYALVQEDIQRVVQAVPGKIVKVILETAMLDNAQKIIACSLSKTAGAHFVKTSTGFGPGGATLEDIALMRHVVGPELGVKASGGVRSYDDAVAMLQAGANRIGASSSIHIVSGKAAQKNAKGY